MLSCLLLMAEEDSREQVIYLYKTFHREMLIFARSRLKKMGRQDYQTEAEDVVQNAFVKLVKYVHRVDFARGEKVLRVYVLSVTENEISTFLAKENTAPLSNEMVDAYSEEAFFEGLALEENRERIEEALTELDPRYTVVLVLRFLENRSVDEIATFLGISNTAVYARLSKAKQAFREKIKEVL